MGNTSCLVTSKVRFPVHGTCHLWLKGTGGKTKNNKSEKAHIRMAEYLTFLFLFCLCFLECLAVNETSAVNCTLKCLKLQYTCVGNCQISV